MSQDSQKTVSLILLGSPGNGKSATGNSIIGKQVFKTAAGTSTNLSSSVMESYIYEDLKVNVVDVPGVQADQSPDDSLNSFIELLDQAFKLCSNKFNALVIVLKYGQRFTRQESDLIKFVKGVLGKNVIRDFGICIVTHGDNFEQDEDNESFEHWCEMQEGDIKSLFTECNYRCVLLNNRSKDLNTTKSQMNSIMRNIAVQKEYSEKEKIAAKNDLQKLIVETKAPKIKQETMNFIQEKRELIVNIQAYLTLQKQIFDYKNVLSDIEKFEKSLIEKYGEPDYIKEPLSMIKILQLEVASKIKNCEFSQQMKQQPISSGPKYMPRVETHFDGRSEVRRVEDPLYAPHRSSLHEQSDDHETFFQKIIRLILVIWTYFRNFLN
ncbi:AIG protein [Biomphalaria glabrata]|nr:AIG protein [Biomphalaria glabrata]